jgi:hypothetical protein
MPEAWLRGPVPGVPEDLMPAAHSLMDAVEDMERSAAELSPAQLWARPGGAPSIGFHLRHARGSIERLLTYARGESLDADQLAAIPLEGQPGESPETVAELIASLRLGLAAALDAYRGTDPATLSDVRTVGRTGLPSNVRGLLFHAAEHARRHAGQVIATATVLRGLEAEKRARGPEERGGAA